MVHDEEIQEMVRSVPSEPPPRPKAHKIYVVLLCLIAAVPACYVLAHTIYEKYFESTPPTITLLKVPEGLGSTAAPLTFAVEDSGAGVSEIVVRMKQRIGSEREILRKKVERTPRLEETLELGGEGSGIDSGSVSLTILAFDKSLWTNTVTQELTLKVDYSRPRAAIITSQHNARTGGSQLAFYRIKGNEVAASGVKVGEDFFYGFPAKGLDPTFIDRDLYVVFYGLDIRTTTPETPVKVFSQNSVGNTSLGNFYNLVAQRKPRKITVTSSTRATSPLVKDDFTPLSKPSLEVARWTLPFMPPKGTITVNFADDRLTKFRDEEIARELSTGYEFRFNLNERSIPAANDGIVRVVQKSALRGSLVVIDHGLGLVSVYDRVNPVSVKEGERVVRGQEIGSAALNESGRNAEAYYELRLHSVPVDAREWWEERWCKDHIVKKIAEIKKQLAFVAAVEGDLPKAAER